MHPSDDRSGRNNLRRGLTLGAALLLAFAVRADDADPGLVPDPGPGLRARFDGLLVEAAVEPRWIDGDRLWYRVAQREGTAWVLVDAARAARAPLFDHARLAAALAARLRRDVAATALPIDRVAVEPDGSVVLLVAGLDVALAWSDATGRLEEQPDDARFHLPRADRRVRSRNGGGGSAIIFVNRTETTLDLAWIDAGGAERGYGRLEPGARRRQHTFAGHAWVLRDADGAAVARFRAADETALAIAAPGDEEAPEPDDAAPSPTPTDPALRPFLHDHDLWLEDRAAGVERRLTDDGTAEDGYGGPLLLSPDGTHLLAVRTRRAATRQVTIVESAPRDAIQPRVHAFDYAKPGDPIDAPRPVLIEVASGRSIPIDDALFPNPWSLTRFAWKPDGSAFRFLHNERGHQRLAYLEVALDGRVRPLIEERSATFIDYAGKQFLHVLEATDEAIWMTERDGWSHLVLVDLATGATTRRITRGPWVVRGVEHVDEAAREVVIRYGGRNADEDPYHEHVARVALDEDRFVPLTDGDGTHAVRFSPDRRWLVDTWSRVDHPPVTELRDARSGALVVELGRADDSALRAAGWIPPERFVAPGRDGTTPIWGIIRRPTTFDPAQRYPVVESIYAGPHAAHVPKAFHVHAGAQDLAELGFIVVQIDGMGTSERSKAFHDVCWKNLADAGFPDRVAWIRAAARREPAMDLERVGIFGGSAGGQNAMRALIDHHDLYSVAVADCGCHDNRMDKIWWNELWMGWPVDEAYARSSNVEHAERMRGALLLIVGELDRNVDPASTMQVAAALVRANRDFELLVVPGAGHGAAETPYGARRRREFLVRELLGAAR